MSTASTQEIKNSSQLVEQENLNDYKSALETLNLPDKLILLDLNGTLIAEDESGIPVFDEKHLITFKRVVSEHQQKGTAIGLNSDSPGELLQQFAKSIGLEDSVIVAENGNVVLFRDKVLVVNPLEGIDSIKEKIRSIAQKHQTIEGAERISPEFGGTAFDTNTSQGEYGFGYGRIASVSLFGDPKFIAQLGTEFTAEGCSIDCSPQHGFFAVHPGNYKGNKGRLLAAIAGMNREVHMIGNSSSDRVDPASGAHFYLVHDPAKITPTLQAEAAYISDKQTLEGVNDILNRLLV